MYIRNSKSYPEQVADWYISWGVANSMMYMFL